MSSPPLCLRALLPAAHILLPDRCRGKKHAFEIASTALAALTALPGKTLFRHFIQRERQGSTAIGGGGAIPHIHADIPTPHCVLLRPPAPILYDDDSDDPTDAKVNILFFLIAPAAASAVHLNLLSIFSHMLTDPTFTPQIAPPADSAAIAAAIADWQTQNRATLDAIWSASQ